MNLRSLSVFSFSLLLLASCVNAVDEDGDGTAACVELPGFTVGPALICDPDDSNRNVGQDAEEVCDGVDNDLDGEVDEGFDTDGDGRFGANHPGCLNAHGNNVDCDDDDPANFPGNEEICDNADNNCDEQVDEGLDRDGDGVTPCEEAPDCDDDDPANFPGNEEVCDNADNNCDEQVDEGLDRDGDGFTPCALPVGDCNDDPFSERAPFIHPDAEEICDGVADNNCDGVDDPAESDLDQDGETGCSDCDDNDPERSFLFEEVCDEGSVDNDCDGLPDVLDPDTDFDEDGYSVCFDDCDDLNPNIHPGKNEVCNSFDDNCDNQIDEGFDQDFDTFTSCGGDCNDLDPAFNPNAPEICDGADNDCNGFTDFDQAGVPGEIDGDADGWLSCEDCDDADADANNDDADGDTFSTCGPDNIANSGDEDCNDVLLDPFAADTYPGAPPLCDEVNNDCSDLSWPAVPAVEVDDDLDGMIDCAGDCDDADPLTYTGATPTCGGSTDNDCDGVVDSIDVSDDGDPETECDGDCDDTDPTVYSTAPELCDGIDNDCFGGQSSSEDDNDIDDYVSCTIDAGGWDNLATIPAGGDDCDDSNSTIYPTAPEFCDGLDHDCDGLVDGADPDTDQDNDGFTSCGVDCDDNNAAIFPGALEVCDGADNDCDGSVDEGFDIDGDGFTSCGGDCDDNDPTFNPGATEICDGLDNDCNGSLPPAEQDNDGDGLMVCEVDCDDNNAAVGNGFPEICGDTFDNDCNGWVDFQDIACPGGCVPDTTTPNAVANGDFETDVTGWFEVTSGGPTEDTFAPFQEFQWSYSGGFSMALWNPTTGSVEDDTVGTTFSLPDGPSMIAFGARIIGSGSQLNIEVAVVDENDYTQSAGIDPLNPQVLTIENPWQSFQICFGATTVPGNRVLLISYGNLGAFGSLLIDTVVIHSTL